MTTRSLISASEVPLWYHVMVDGRLVMSEIIGQWRTTDCILLKMLIILLLSSSCRSLGGPTQYKD